MNGTEQKIMHDLLHLVLDQREEDHKIRTYKDQDEHMIVERAKILLGMVASNPCDVCGILVREDEYWGYDNPTGKASTCVRIVLVKSTKTSPKKTTFQTMKEVSDDQ